jgi:hypothetical protein
VCCKQTQASCPVLIVCELFLELLLYSLFISPVFYRILYPYNVVLSSLQLGACSLQLVACSLGPGPEASASG